MSAISPTLRISIVIPVYKGERTLDALVDELLAYSEQQSTPKGRDFVVSEVLLVHDCGPDRSDLAIERLTERYPFVKPVWLSRNYGQHAATMAGMASSNGDWVITMDEDGQQNPTHFGNLIDAALDSDLQVVYAEPINSPPHGWLRNVFSNVAKKVANFLMNSRRPVKFNSFRLVSGEISRTLAAYCSNGVYLDVGLFWIAGRIGNCPVELRNEMDRPSGYSYWKLFGHFWSLILSTGTRPLRLITIVGVCSVLFGVALSLYALYGKFFVGSFVPGWTSLLIVVSFFSGTTLAALGVIAEYLALTMGIVMGKPLYVIVSKPTRSGISK